MVLRPKLAGGRRGLPHELPASPHENATNQKHVLAEVGKLEVLLRGGILTLAQVQAADPATEPKPGKAQLYVFDDGATPELRVRYKQADGTLLTGSVTLA